MTNEEHNKFSQILLEIADLTLDMDANNSSATLHFTDEDCMNALILFNSITSNRAVHSLQKNKVDIEFAKELAADMGTKLGALFKARTGIDPKEYLKNI